MEKLQPILAISLSAILFFCFPGVLLIRAIKIPDALSRLIFTFFLSTGFWISVSWYISWVSLPLDTTVVSLLGIFIVSFIALTILKKKDLTPPSPFSKKICAHHIVLFSFLLLLAYPLLFITIPPGCDTAMHGYITRLIINNNGLPHSYRPILPVDHFGSYSAGYDVLTAIIAWMHTDLLRHATNFMSVIVYPLSVLGVVFFLKQFFSERTAIYTTIIYWALNGTLQSTITWGGDPTMLSFGFCMFSAGAVLYAVREQNATALILSSITMAAIPLVHAIPAITFAYLAIPGYGLLFIHFKDRRKWLLTNTIVLLIASILLLVPFLFHLRNENSPQLTVMIKDWQNKMMGNRLTTHLIDNMLITLDEIKYRIGDVPVILAGISLVFLLALKQYRYVVNILFFLAVIYVLIFNYGYWFLPGSELLYPERVVFFMIVAVSFYFGYALQVLGSRRLDFTLFKKTISIYMLLVVILLAIGLPKVFGTINNLRNIDINCNAGTAAAFTWINRNAGPNALFVASYGDAGMWIPAFTNRPTLGTHMHFIHEVMHVRDSLNAYTGPRYIFVTKRDITTHSPILTQIQKRSRLFSNNDVAIYH